jgi:hypothetical protein
MDNDPEFLGNLLQGGSKRVRQRLYLIKPDC